MSWATVLRAHIIREYSKRSETSELYAVRVISDDEIAIVFADGPNRPLKGIRLDRQAVRSGPERIRVSSLSEIAFDLVVMGICEPRLARYFLPPDEEGISWMSAERWLDDVG